MDGSAVNSSPSASGYYWSECDTYSDDAGQSGGTSAGLLVLFIISCFESLVGIPSNLWLVCHILSKRSKDGGVLPADFFPFHLALTQLTFYPIIPVMCVNHFLLKTNYLLSMMQFMTAMGLIMRPLLLCLVCVEKYLAVVRPLVYLRFKAHRYRWGCLGVSWCIYIILVSSTFLGDSLISHCGLFIPILLIDSYCCLSVLKTLQKPPPGDTEMVEKNKKREEKRKTLEDRSGAVSQKESENKKMKIERNELRGKGGMNSMKKRAFNTIVIIQAVLTFSYLPPIITICMKGLLPPLVFKCQFQAMSLAAAISCSYLQPLLYMHRLRKLPCMKPRNK